MDREFEQVLEEHTAGDPRNGERRWTQLTPTQIAEQLQTPEATVSPYVVKQLLKKHRYVKRSAQKKQRLGDCDHQDEQFQTIARLKADYLAAGYPVISIDTKKKEVLGNLYRGWTTLDLDPD